MFTMPAEIMLLLSHFAPVFSERVWDGVLVLVAGAILTPGRRTVCAILRVMGLSEEEQYQNYHRVLNRAVWSELKVSQILFGLLVRVLGGETIVLGVDDTLERRPGEKIKDKGMFHDAVRSSKKHPVTSPGLRWLSVQMLTKLPWVERVWGLPFLTILTRSKARDEAEGKRHKTLGEWTRQAITLIRRWCPDRQLVLVVDGSLCAIWLAQRCVQVGVTFVSRLRLDAQLYDFPPEPPQRKPGKKPNKGPKQIKLAERLTHPDTLWQRQRISWYGGGQRDLKFTSGVSLWHRPGYPPLPLRWVVVADPVGKLSPAAFFCTDLDASPLQLLAWVIMRWGMEVTFEESRAHLGVETQRQWSDRAIARTTPCLLGLFSFIILLAHQLSLDHPIPTRSAAWYTKSQPTFSDVIAFVRHYLWRHLHFVQSPVSARWIAIPEPVLNGLVDILCHVT